MLVRSQPAAPLRLLGALVLALACLATLPADASAHSHLLLSKPAADAVVADAPDRVELLFSGTVVAAEGSVQVFAPDESRVDVDAASPRRGERIAQRIRAETPGTYGVAYRVSSEDGHVITGAFTFVVGTASAGASGDAAAASRDAARIDRGVQVAFSVVRFVELFSLLVAAGGGIFACLVAPGWRPRFVLPALFVLLTSYATSFVLDAAIVQGSLPQALRLDALRDAMRTPFGLSVQVRALVAAVAIPPTLLLRARADLPLASRVPLAVVFAGLAASLSITGHAVTTEPTVLRLPLDMVHVIAAAAWAGGLVQLAALAPFASAHVRSIARFSGIAFASVVVLFATGAYATVAELGLRPAQLVDSEYGRLVAGKLLLFAGTVPLAWNNLRSFVPAITARPLDARRMLRQYVARELALLLFVVALTVWLIATPQPG